MEKVDHEYLLELEMIEEMLEEGFVEYCGC